MNGWDIGIIIALLTAVGSIINSFLQRRKIKADAAATVTEMYDKLCDQLTKRIDILQGRVYALEQENRDLRKALAESEAKNTKLQTEVDDLTTRLERYENQ